MIVIVLLASLAALALAYAVALLRAAARRHALRPPAEAIALGAVTNFFDTLGIGSFAPTTAWMKLRELVPDSFMPATLNAGHALPTVVQALVFIQLVRVDPALLLSCIAAAVAGAVIGAPLVVRMPVRWVQAIVGIAMLIAADSTRWPTSTCCQWVVIRLPCVAALFAIAVVTHVLLGALMTFGIGLYAPSLILLSLMGLNPAAAFPVMMGACAFLMPVSGLRFVRTERIDLRVVLGLAIGGIPAVLLAAFVVKSLPLVALRWGVVAVVVYAAILLLLAAVRRPVIEERFDPAR